MTEPGSKILQRMLERIYASLGSGPLMACRPHASRQRIDLSQLARLDGPTGSALISALLSDERSVKLALPKVDPNEVEPDSSASDASGAPVKKKDALQALWSKLRTISEDAKTYEQDTGVQALFVGYPVLHLPPSTKDLGGAFSSKRVLAPIAFIPVQLSIKATRPASVTIEAVADGAELVIPNVALLAWIQQATGQKLTDLFADDEGVEPWREINDIVAVVCKALGLAVPAAFGPESATTATPRSDSEDAKVASVLPSAVLGLFPVSNQGLLRDLEALVDGEAIAGPLVSFLQSGVELGARTDADADESVGIASDRCVSAADPCQMRAVRIARRASGLVVHGPPGTGKSQTITNVIADHLAQGERVLFVCDKRTALDVVHYRLDHIGLGPLCAVVHDARRDQRELYRVIRDQLDTLPDAKPGPSPMSALTLADRQLQEVHGELSEYLSALHEATDDDAPSLHDLVGRWFAIDVPDDLAAETLDSGSAEVLHTFELGVREALQRGLKEDYPRNAWARCAGLSLKEYLAKPHDDWTKALEALQSLAETLDGTAGGDVLPFDPAQDAVAQSKARLALAEAIEKVVERGCEGELARWVVADSKERARCEEEFGPLVASAEALDGAPLDRELMSLVTDAEPNLQQRTLWSASLGSYLQVARRWYRFLFFGRRKSALAIVAQFGLALTAESAERVHAFLAALRLRRTIQSWCSTVLPNVSQRLLPDRELTKAVGDYAAIFGALGVLDDHRARRLMPPTVETRLRDSAGVAVTVSVLRASSERGRRLDAFRKATEQSGLLDEAERKRLYEVACGSTAVGGDVATLVRQRGSLEGVLHIRERQAVLPGDVKRLVGVLLECSADPDLGWSVVRKAGLAGTMAKRLQDSPYLQQMDSDRAAALYTRYRSLDGERRGLARQAILHRWLAKQRERLLATTGSRLNSQGADVRRRLVMRGERAMKLRQVIAAGSAMDGGDPLFDLRPVWMASPEVVAQVFPRAPIFDVVIFDEASQCRLEEALPVLTRAKRVVIAGDPQQLPPTRFFESAVAQSQDEEAETTQELFEDQQSDTEDLLGAALNIAIEQAYLDVHYRSSNSDLIQFSNANFYEARLQAIPGHPANRTKIPPLRLTHAAGVYDKRTNLKEADEVVRIVRRLLGQEQPPSIGIACFNLTQRDAIVEALDKAAFEDNAFSAKLAAARIRRGAASFEGLFVKNLENVQGDERDHMIISTTYGPDPKGKFYRRFGPLAMAGGGRRLNVLVTRAREAVHIVTSIPAEVYRGLPVLEPGRKPNGAWLLFSYLNYAEYLAEEYGKANARLSGGLTSEATSMVRESPTPSELAIALGRHFSTAHGISNEVHWGNSGFAVDAALIHPERKDDVTIGVLCDATRFDKAPDRVQWEIFRTDILESQGWKLHRLWTPQLLRNPKGAINAVLLEMQRWLREDAAKPKEQPKSQAPERDVSLN